jgi:hypothetical protein
MDIMFIWEVLGYNGKLEGIMITKYGAVHVELTVKRALFISFYKKIHCNVYLICGNTLESWWP